VAVGNSRIDFALETSAGMHLVEVKSVTMAVSSSNAQETTLEARFPDTVSLRAQKQVHKIIAHKRSGKAATLLFIVQRGDCTSFSASYEHDPVYSTLVWEASKMGVNIVAAQVRLDPQTREIFLDKLLPVDLRQPAEGAEQQSETPKPRTKRKRA
jgi:sugar fermentation stimulation protein A